MHYYRFVACYDAPCRSLANTKVHVTSSRKATQPRLAHVQHALCSCPGAVGPTFAPPDMQHSFTVVYVEGPGISECALFETDHKDREKSMWQFTAAALQFLDTFSALIYVRRPGFAVAAGPSFAGLIVALC